LYSEKVAGGRHIVAAKAGAVQVVGFDMEGVNLN
jgi:hypothetical protein